MDQFRRRLLAGSAAIACVIAFGTVGYWLLGGGQWTLFECFYMTVITISTVGYGELLPGMAQMPAARGFTAVLLLFGTGTLVYAVSVLTAFVVEGDLREALQRSKRHKRIKAMKQHVIVCGAGSTGRHIISELCTSGHAVVAVDKRESILRELAAQHPGANFSFIVGDASEDETLHKAGVAQAAGLVAALSSDKDNVYVIVTARQLGPSLRIIARCAELTHVEKMRRAGADSVVSPNHIGGMRMASELLRPVAVRFLDDMLRDYSQHVRIEDITVGDLRTTLDDLQVHARYGLCVLALREPGSKTWQYNPPPTTVITRGAAVVVLGDVAQVSKLRHVLAATTAPA